MSCPREDVGPHGPWSSEGEEGESPAPQCESIPAHVSRPVVEAGVLGEATPEDQSFPAPVSRDDLLVTIGPQDEDWPDVSDDEDGSIEGGVLVPVPAASHDPTPSDLDSQPFPAPVEICETWDEEEAA